MKKMIFVVAISLSAALFAGCAKEQTATTSTETSTTSAATTTSATTDSAATAAPAATASTAAATTDDKIGIAECDNYISKYESCVKDKVPASAQAAMKTAFDAQRKAWKDAAANPQSRAALAQGCTTATTMAKQSMTAYGCTW